MDCVFRHTRSLGWQTPRWSPAISARKAIAEAFPRRLSGTIAMAIEAPNGTALTDAVRHFAEHVGGKARG